MKQMLLQEKYPVFTMELDKSETSFKSVDEIINYFKNKIEEHKVAKNIAIFDHYTHTKEMEEGSIEPSILDAKDIVFCFGTAIPNPLVLAVRPRSMGVAELQDKFVVSFMEAPMPLANTAMEAWALGLRNI